jgi:phage gpG-like protein
MTGADFTREGGDAFRSSCAVATADLERVTPEAAGRIVAQRAAVAAPKESGTLSRSVTAETTDTEVLVGSDLVYAPVQEFGSGSHNIAPHPYLIPALEASAAQVAAAYAEEAQRVLDGIHGV